MLLDVEVLVQIIPALLEADKALVNLSNRDIVAMANADALFAMGLRNPDVMERGFTDYANISTGFEDDLLNITLKFRDGTISMGEASNRFKALCGDRYQKLFMAGTEGVGNPSYRDVGLTRKDLAFINKARRAEMRYFRKFLHDMANPKHLPFDQIPRDASGKMLSGYSVQRHSYVNRAKYYAQSGKAQFYNGMLAGAGSEMKVKWVLGIPQTKHCPVCPIYAKKFWTWKTLPTVPRGGDTPCLFKCYCHLEFVTKTKGRTLDVPGLAAQVGSGTVQGLTAQGRYAKITDYSGATSTGINAQMLEMRVMNMNKARQMVSLGGADKAYWIAMRRELNQQLITSAKAYGLKITPTTSVKDLIATIQSAKRIGGTVFSLKGPADYSALSNLDEVIFVRGDFSGTGVVVVAPDGRRYFSSPDGKNILINYDQDIIFLLKKSKSSLIVSVESECINIIEAYNKNPMKIEYASCIGKDGKVLFSNVSGDATTVHFNSSQSNLMINEGQILIHNHPSGGSFSRADVGALALGNMEGMVVTKDYIYKITPNYNSPSCPWGKGKFVSEAFSGDYNTMIQKNKLVYEPKCVSEVANVMSVHRAGRLTEIEADRVIQSIYNKYNELILETSIVELADKWGFTYEKTPVYDSGMTLPPVIEAIIRKGNIPITTYFNAATLSDPVKYKSIYLRKIFNGDKELYKFFVELYKQAGEDGAFFPINLAWINFRQSYIETEEGGWEKL